MTSSDNKIWQDDTLLDVQHKASVLTSVSSGVAAVEQFLSIRTSQDVSPRIVTERKLLKKHGAAGFRCKTNLCKPLSKEAIISGVKTLGDWEDIHKDEKKWLALCHGQSHRDILQYVPLKLRKGTAFFMIDKKAVTNPHVVMDLQVDLEAFANIFHESGRARHSTGAMFDGVIWCYAPTSLIFDAKLHELLRKMVKPEAYLLSAYLTFRQKKPHIFTMQQQQQLIKTTLVNSTVSALNVAERRLRDLHKITDTSTSQDLLATMAKNVHDLLR